ncbi:MAG: thioredoxin [Gammaproteobacteria bacterium]|nr:thioredoxin [Gammaproteobacteria bacterium]
MHSIDVTAQNFTTEVVAASRNAPVLVDFWAPWCGPCRSLMPVLTKLAESYQGAFRLAKVNIDEQQALATQFGVRSVPSVKLVKNGQIVDEFTGAIPETQIRAFLDKHVQRASDQRMQQAHARYLQGDASALTDMIEIANSDPANHTIRLQWVDVLMNEKRFTDAKAILEALPEEVRSKAEISGLLTRLHAMETARDLPDMPSLLQRVQADPGDFLAREQLSTHYILQANYTAAMDQLLEIMRRDRNYGEDAGRKGLLKVFAMLGGNGELVTRYRQKMASLMY